MAETKYIVDGVIYTEDSERKVIADGVIVEETTAAAGGGQSILPLIVNAHEMNQTGGTL